MPYLVQLTHKTFPPARLRDIGTGVMHLLSDTWATVMDALPPSAVGDPLYVVEQISDSDAAELRALAAEPTAPRPVLVTRVVHDRVLRNIPPGPSVEPCSPEATPAVQGGPPLRKKRGA